MLQNGVTPLDRSACPTISGSILSSATSISGSTVANASGTQIVVYRTRASVTTTLGTVSTTTSSWTLSSGVSGNLAVGDVITATAKGTGYGVSVANCSSKTVVSATCTKPSAPVLSAIGNGDKILTGTKVAGTHDVTIYKVDGTKLTGGTTSNPFSATGTTYTYTHGTGSVKVPDGSYYVTISLSGCESLPSNIAQNNCTASTVPTFSVGYNLYKSSTAILVTAASGEALRVWINGIPSATTATGTGAQQSIALSGLNTGDLVKIVGANNNTKPCEAVSAELTVLADPVNSIAPVVTGTYCLPAGTNTVNVTGTSVEAAGTTINLFNQANSSLGSTTVSATGTWTVGSIGINPATITSMYARATVSGGNQSVASASVSVTEKTSNIPTISTSPLVEGASSISGTSVNGATIKLYVDGAIVSGATTTLSGTTSWTISGLASYVFYSGASVTVTATLTSKCESTASTAVQVVCSAPTTPVVTSGNITYCNGSSGSYTLASSTSLVLYQLVNSSGVAVGNQSIGTGSSIMLYTDVLTSDLNNVFVKASKILDPSCTSTSSSSINFTPQSPSPTINFSSSSVAVVSGSTVANFAYTNGANAPTNYSIAFSIAAKNQGFVNVSSTNIPATPLAITVPAAAAVGTYTGVLTLTDATACGTDYNISIVIYTAGAAATISSQPTGVSKCSGESAAFSVVASNAQSYQWQVNTGAGFGNISNGGVYSGASSGNLSISNNAGLNGYIYRVLVKGYDNVDVASTSATLSVIAITPGSIGTNQSISSGNTPAGLTSVSDATGTSVTYQWKSSTDNVSYSNISGATSSTYSPGALTATTYYKRQATSTMSGYSCVAESNVVTITVTSITATKLAFTTQPSNTASGATLSDVVITIQDASGNTVTSSTASVTLAIGTNPASGTLSGTKTVAAVGGVATFSTLNIDNAGTGYTLVASATGLTGATSNTFNITSGAASTIAINAGDGQSATVGTAVSTAPSVIVRDASNNPVSGVSVTFAVATGGGSGTVLNATTNASGIATVGSWTLGTTAGSNTMTATSGSLTGSPITFTATGTAGAASTIAINAGDGQSATVGTAVSTAPSVIVRDASNNPVSGVSVTFAVATGGGSGTVLNATTNASGIATVGSWTLGATAGSNTMTATSGSLTGSPITFTATGTAGAASTIAINAGDGQSATVGTAVSTAPSVIVRDASNNPVSGVSVTFAVATGGGSGTVLNATTNASGIATVGSWTLGTTAGSNTMTATSGSLTGSPITFTATGTAGAATQLVLTTQPSNTASGATLSDVVITIQDASGNTVTSSTASVTLAIGTNPASGTLSGTKTVAAVGGVATFSTLNIDNAGTGYTLVASATGLTGATSNTFNITSGAASTIAINAGDGQSATVGTAVSTAPSVIVRDASNNPVSGVSVTFAVATGGGSGTVLSATTNASGIATVGSWTLGTTAGSNTMTATSGSLTGSPITFTATGTAGAASTIAINAGDGQSATVGTAVSTAPSVIVRDASNNPVSGVSVTFAVATGGGSGTVLNATTNASGIATVGSWTLGTTAGSNTMTATSGSLTGSPITFTATGTAGAASTIAINAGDGQSATVGTAVSTAPSVIVRDASNNPVSGVSVTFAVATGGGSGTVLNATTNASGIATVGSWTLGTTAGSNTMTATSGSLTGSPITFTATGTAGAATQLVLTTQPSNTASGATLSDVVITIQDASGNTVTSSTASVTLAIGTNPASGTLSGTKTVAAVGGVATFSTLNIDNAGTGYTLVASATGLTGATSNTFNITSGAASTIAINAGDGQSATVGTAVSTAPSVIVRDASNNPVSGVSVTFAVATGGGSGTVLSATTNASGIATVGSWTLGTTAGSNTMTATSGSLTGSPITFTATGTAGAASTIAINAGDGQSATVGTAVSTAPSVIVRDASNNPVSGVSVTFAVATGGGSGTVLNATTNASGIATVGSWTLGTTAGSNTMTATSGSLTGSPITFTATGTVWRSKHNRYQRRRWPKCNSRHGSKHRPKRNCKRRFKQSSIRRFCNLCSRNRRWFRHSIECYNKCEWNRDSR